MEMKRTGFLTRTNSRKITRLFSDGGNTANAPEKASIIGVAHENNIKSSKNAKYIWDTLTSLKDKNGQQLLSPYIVAGIMGNMYEESKFNPAASSGTYKGLVQLSPGLYQYYETYLNSRNLIDSLENQLNYLIPIFTVRDNHNPHNIEGQHIYRNEWGGAGRQDRFLNGNYTSARDAAEAFADLFERMEADTKEQRKNYADFIYNYFTGNIVLKFGGILKRK